MLTIETDDSGIVLIRASGRLSKADYDRVVPEFERLARTGGPVRMLIELDDFHGMGSAGAVEDLKFDSRHQNDMGRVAIIGDRAWQEWGTRLSKPFFKAEMRYFDRTRRRLPGPGCPDPDGPP